MAINYFVGWSREDLEKELRLCQEDIARGKSLMQWGAGDSQGSSKILISLRERYEQIYFALSEDYPDDYPPAAGARTRRTTPRYL